LEKKTAEVSVNYSRTAASVTCNMRRMGTPKATSKARKTTKKARKTTTATKAKGWVQQIFEDKAGNDRRQVQKHGVLRRQTRVSQFSDVVT
jgi:hypothetical protein